MAKASLVFSIAVLTAKAKAMHTYTSHSTDSRAWSADMHLKASIRPAVSMAHGHRWMRLRT